MARLRALAGRAAARTWQEIKKAKSPWVYICSWPFNTQFMVGHIVSAFIFGMIYYGIAISSGVELGLVNSLFLSSSTQTNTGLNPVNLQNLGVPIQALMQVQMQIGSHRFISILILWKRHFELRKRRGKQTDASSRTDSCWSDRNSRDHDSHVEDIELAALFPGFDYTVDAARGRNARATRLLLYYILFLETVLLGAAALAGALIGARNEEAAKSDLNAHWIGAYTMLSGFQNNGTNLLPYGMMSYAEDITMQLYLCFFMLAGSTGWPILLRILVWIPWKVCSLLGKRSRKWALRADTLSFMLKNSRRCYLYLHPAKHTVWLAISILGFNLVDWFLFTTMLYPLKQVKDTPTAQWVLNGLFQCVALRTTGYTIVGLSSMMQAYQFVQIVMVYLAFFPTTVTMNSSNPSEELALDMYDQDEGIEPPEEHFWQYIRSPSWKFIIEQVELVQNHDHSTILLAVLAILLARIKKIISSSDDTVFAVIFEVISAYSNIGVSMGVANDGYSFSGSWNWESQFMLIVVMYLGKARCLPAATDMATMRHGEKEAADEDQVAEIRHEKLHESLDRETWGKIEVSLRERVGSNRGGPPSEIELVRQRWSAPS